MGTEAKRNHMGNIRDRIQESIDKATSGAKDQVAESTGKIQVGMDPSVCEGCPHRGEGKLKRCGLCGCPTLEGFPLHQMGMIPENCPRHRAHRRATNNADDFR